MRYVLALILAVTVSLLVAAPAHGASLPAAEGQSTHGLEYVALGDSFSSGLGLPHPVSNSPSFCHRSTINFPHRVARALGLTLKDATCAGATTSNVISSPLKYGKGSSPPQSGSLNSQTDVVTITIGGNDLGFVDATKSCVALGREGPLLLAKAPNCRSLFVRDSADELSQRIDSAVMNGTDAYPSGLEKTFATIAKKAPHARVFVIGYPTIMPDPAHIPVGGCFNAKLTGTDLADAHAVDIFPFTDTDTSYLNSIEQKLDAATGTAARAAGFTYISLLRSTAANSACAPAKERFLNGVSIDRSASGSVVLRAGSLHPDDLGTAFLADAVAPKIAAAFPAKTTTPAGSPAFPWAPIWVSAAGVLVLCVGVIVFVVRRRRRSTTTTS
ncbi:SGNH/GDSL hydrolase family protein [Glaciihabitans sp. INWT7]|uniref:SGNH/GDSL hydrolase family protein n=1 Tax=Glaciihabitans sp. INWT7 TaxID=2596912 RepID=UPI001625A578|nr:SGNH/GDSL hydrolase family protein [Glaciihabitans sp. INWT7]